MFSVFRNAWKVQDLRKKILFTAFVILIFRLGCNITVPFLDSTAMGNLFQGYSESGNIFSYLNIMSGGAMEKATIFSLSISPYINASIIMQLLMVAIPPLERMMKEDGERGKKIMESWTRYLSIAFSFLLGFGYYTVLKNAANVVSESAGVFGALVIVFTFAAGATIIMWLGEQINDKGIGNGISILLFAGIVSRIPSLANIFVANIQAGAVNAILAVVFLIGIVAMIAFVVFVTNGERRIPVQYAKQVKGRKMYGGQNTNIPLKVNMTGVLPIIFAQSFVMLPPTIVNFFPSLNKGWFGAVVSAINVGGWLYTVVMFLLIIFFSYFYTVITFNPVEVANNLKKNGGFIMGIRPGKPTADFITKSLNRITLIGAVFLGLVSAIPNFVAMVNSSLASVAIGGTTLLIVVGVALETVKTLESQMLMRHYKGFLE
ncbi:MAG: preprotein translocase subunit SecY [Clostridiales bacterium]|nr:MAG: preprotein translocase subunit SecY [Clostridiales bacterium]